MDLCVKKNEGRLYIEVESENEESDEASSSSSSCVVVLGDKIKHFSHEHELVLDNEEIVTNGDKKCCDGCASPILTATYSCPRPECNFSLHKACAQIGEDKPHWASRDPVPVIMESHFECRFCKYDSSGFRSIGKGVDGNRRKICHRCSEIDFTTKHEAHAQHFLFCDEDHKGPCSGCGKEMGNYGGYKCTLAEEEENCKFFALDYRCLTRPLTAEHRFHHHPLKLTYEDPYKDDDGDPFQHMCEICEDRRDPKLWFYRCDECDFDAHPDCVLGEYPFIKRGKELLAISAQNLLGWLIPNQKDGEAEIYTKGCLYYSSAIKSKSKNPTGIGNLIRFGGAGSEASIHLHLDH
ncbi:hypothetical protein SLEP1_g41945 [Rubroshorea leprosula]|uniref:DC1 domain-containing protein n=1 Tax=Rubroshorea leprosula TaxID=152421 RepID=A0AAV5L910_9ROSI|nr:hypothetical protein SLEP1_g41945 [Rubroshorea leprosula]